MIKWGKLPPGGSAIGGWLLDGLVKCQVWYDSEISSFAVSFYGPDGKTIRLGENYGDLQGAKQGAEGYMQALIKKTTVPGPGRLGLTLTGPAGELLGQSYIDMSYAGDGGLIDLIVTQARVMAYLWLANEVEKKGNLK